MAFLHFFISCFKSFFIFPAYTWLEFKRGSLKFCNKLQNISNKSLAILKPILSGYSFILVESLYGTIFIKNNNYLILLRVVMKFVEALQITHSSKRIKSHFFFSHNRFKNQKMSFGCSQNYTFFIFNIFKNI